MTATEVLMAAKSFKCEVRRMVNEQISLLRDVEDSLRLSEIITSLMGHNAPTFRQWRKVLWLLFKKKFNNRDALYTIYVLAGIKAKEEERRISSKQKREAFQKRQQKFSKWFWDQFKQVKP
ncbi:MAG: hypothetical protein Q8N90_01900 [bacterium]|nr:hypothetical protein [bacterium]